MLSDARDGMESCERFYGIVLSRVIHTENTKKAAPSLASHSADAALQPTDAQVPEPDVDTPPLPISGLARLDIPLDKSF